MVAIQPWRTPHFNNCKKTLVLSPDLQRALSLHQAGRFREAEAIYQHMLAANPNQPAVLYLLGMLRAQTNRFPEARDLLLKAVDRSPRNVEILAALGHVCLALDALPEAEKWLRKALGISPTDPAALVHLSRVLLRRANLVEAERFARALCRVERESPKSVDLLASILLAQDRFIETEELCRKTLAAFPDDIDLLIRLGTVVRQLGRIREAAEKFEQAARCSKNDPRPLHFLGLCHSERKDYERAIACFRAALAIQPANEDAKFCLGETLITQGLTTEGRRILDEVTTNNPRHWHARWARLWALPLICEDQSDLQAALDDFEIQLTRMERDVSAALESDLPAIVLAARSKTAFQLSYLGQIDLSVQQRYGALLTRIGAAAYPHYATSLPRRGITHGERIRVGFVSSYFYNHSVSKTHGAWVTQLPNDQFDVHVFHLDDFADPVTERIKSKANYHACAKLREEKLIAEIAGSKLDVLIWLDIGMEARVQIPSTLRLAPVQAVTWGHPVTSGLHNMDWYLSSELMEPASAELHYTEKLVRLPNLSVAYPEPVIAEAHPPALVVELKSAGQTIFLCSQNLAKLLPIDDDVFASIAAAVPNSVFIFIAHRQQRATDIFKKRMAAAFERLGIDAAERIHMVDRLGQNDFYALNRIADVVLDSIAWAGCNSTLEALACYKPVVTLPGETMRSRHGYAILSFAGLRELIAQDKAEYVAIAVRLATDAEWRREIEARIKESKHVLFNDQLPIHALAEWLKSATAQIPDP